MAGDWTFYQNPEWVRRSKPAFDRWNELQGNRFNFHNKAHLSMQFEDFKKYGPRYDGMGTRSGIGRTILNGGSDSSGRTFYSGKDGVSPFLDQGRRVRSLDFNQRAYSTLLQKDYSSVSNDKYFPNRQLPGGQGSWSNSSFMGRLGIVSGVAGNAAYAWNVLDSRSPEDVRAIGIGQVVGSGFIGGAGFLNSTGSIGSRALGALGSLASPVTFRLFSGLSTLNSTGQTLGADPERAYNSRYNTLIDSTVFGSSFGPVGGVVGLGLGLVNSGLLNNEGYRASYEASRANNARTKADLNSFYRQFNLSGNNSQSLLSRRFDVGLSVGQKLADAAAFRIDQFSMDASLVNLPRQAAGVPSSTDFDTAFRGLRSSAAVGTGIFKGSSYSQRAELLATELYQRPNLAGVKNFGESIYNRRGGIYAGFDDVEKTLEGSLNEKISSLGQISYGASNQLKNYGNYQIQSGLSNAAGREYVASGRRIQNMERQIATPVIAPSAPRQMTTMNFRTGRQEVYHKSQTIGDGIASLAGSVLNPIWSSVKGFLGAPAVQQEKAARSAANIERENRAAMASQRLSGLRRDNPALANAAMQGSRIDPFAIAQGLKGHSGGGGGGYNNSEAQAYRREQAARQAKMDADRARGEQLGLLGAQAWARNSSVTPAEPIHIGYNHYRVEGQVDNPALASPMTYYRSKMTAFQNERSIAAESFSSGMKDYAREESEYKSNYNKDVAAVPKSFKSTPDGKTYLKGLEARRNEAIKIVQSKRKQLELANKELESTVKQNEDAFGKDFYESNSLDLKNSSFNDKLNTFKDKRDLLNIKRGHLISLVQNKAINASTYVNDELNLQRQSIEDQFGENQLYIDRDKEQLARQREATKMSASFVGPGRAVAGGLQELEFKSRENSFNTRQASNNASRAEALKMVTGPEALRMRTNANASVISPYVTPYVNAAIGGVTTGDFKTAGTSILQTAQSQFGQVASSSVSKYIGGKYAAYQNANPNATPMQFAGSIFGKLTGGIKAGTQGTSSAIAGVSSKAALAGQTTGMSGVASFAMMAAPFAIAGASAISAARSGGNFGQKYLRFIDPLGIMPWTRKKRDIQQETADNAKKNSEIVSKTLKGADQYDIWGLEARVRSLNKEWSKQQKSGKRGKQALRDGAGQLNSILAAVKPFQSYLDYAGRFEGKQYDLKTAQNRTIASINPFQSQPASELYDTFNSMQTSLANTAPQFTAYTPQSVKNAQNAQFKDRVDSSKSLFRQTYNNQKAILNQSISYDTVDLAYQQRGSVLSANQRSLDADQMNRQYLNYDRDTRMQVESALGTLQRTDNRSAIVSRLQEDRSFNKGILTRQRDLLSQSNQLSADQEATGIERSTKALNDLVSSGVALDNKFASMLQNLGNTNDEFFKLTLALRDFNEALRKL